MKRASFRIQRTLDEILDQNRTRVQRFTIRDVDVLVICLVFRRQDIDVCFNKDFGFDIKVQRNLIRSFSRPT